MYIFHLLWYNSEKMSASDIHIPSDQKPELPKCPNGRRYTYRNNSVVEVVLVTQWNILVDGGVEACRIDRRLWNTRSTVHTMYWKSRVVMMLIYLSLVIVMATSCAISDAKLVWGHSLIVRYSPRSIQQYSMMTSSDGNIFSVTCTLWRESIGHRWIP